MKLLYPGAASRYVKNDIEILECKKDEKKIAFSTRRICQSAFTMMKKRIIAKGNYFGSPALYLDSLLVCLVSSTTKFKNT